MPEDIDTTTSVVSVKFKIDDLDFKPSPFYRPNGSKDTTHVFSQIAEKRHFEITSFLLDGLLCLNDVLVEYQKEYPDDYYDRWMCLLQWIAALPKLEAIEGERPAFQPKVLSPEYQEILKSIAQSFRSFIQIGTMARRTRIATEDLWSYCRRLMALKYFEYQLALHVNNNFFEKFGYLFLLKSENNSFYRQWIFSKFFDPLDYFGEVFFTFDYELMKIDANRGDSFQETFLNSIAEVKQLSDAEISGVSTFFLESAPRLSNNYFTRMEKFFSDCRASEEGGYGREYLCGHIIPLARRNAQFLKAIRESAVIFEYFSLSRVGKKLPPEEQIQRIMALKAADVFLTEEKVRELIKTDVGVWTNRLQRELNNPIDRMILRVGCQERAVKAAELIAQKLKIQNKIELSPTEVGEYLILLSKRKQEDFSIRYAGNRNAALVFWAYYGETVFEVLKSLREKAVEVQQLRSGSMVTVAQNGLYVLPMLKAFLVDDSASFSALELIFPQEFLLRVLLNKKVNKKSVAWAVALNEYEFLQYNQTRLSIILKQYIVFFNELFSATIFSTHIECKSLFYQLIGIIGCKKMTHEKPKESYVFIFLKDFLWKTVACDDVKRNLENFFEKYTELPSEVLKPSTLIRGFFYKNVPSITPSTKTARLMNNFLVELKRISESQCQPGVVYRT